MLHALRVHPDMLAAMVTSKQSVRTSSRPGLMSWTCMTASHCVTLHLPCMLSLCHTFHSLITVVVRRSPCLDAVVLQVFVAAETPTCTIKQPG